MNATSIPYVKWFGGYITEGTVSDTVVPGQIIASGSVNRNQAPPTNGETFDLTETLNIPLGVDEAGQSKSILASLRITYRVEDWGRAFVDGNKVIDLSEAAEGSTGSYGGHTAWSDTCFVPLSSGTHEVEFTYANIVMPDPSINQIICEYSYRAVELEWGGCKDPSASGECPCAGNTCSIEGGVAEDSMLLTSSSAGTDVKYGLTEDRMRWSCNVGTLRGKGTPLSGRLQLFKTDCDEDLASPAALAFNHPLVAELSLPEGGLVSGARAEIRMGDRVVALRRYADGAVAPIGVDSAGHGLLSLNGGNLRWQDDSGAAWVFDAETGSLISYTGPEQVTVSVAVDDLVVKRDSNGALRQIRSRWDGLLNIEGVSAAGYSVKLYTASQVAGTDAEGFYVLQEGAEAFKTFVMNYENGVFSITEQTPGHEPFVCAWCKGADGAWGMVQGVWEDAVTTSRTSTVLEPGELEVRQQITSVSKGGVVASCTAEVYQKTPVGNLLLTRVEGYGSSVARTSTFEYDGVGNLSAVVQPNGHRTEYRYDAYGRRVRSSELWRAGDYMLITEYSYAYGTAVRYSDELAKVTRKLRRLGTSEMTTLSTETHTYTVSDGLRREVVQTSVPGASYIHTEVHEQWTQDAENPLVRGRIRMNEGYNGVQTWYEYAPSTEHGALYTITRETRVNGEPVPGQAARSVSWIDAAGNTVRQEEYILLTAGTWAKLSGESRTYNVRNQQVGVTHDNGRSMTQELTCTGEMLWEVNEDGVRTDYAYDSARRLIETTRSAVYDGEVCITPETITEYERDAVGRVTSSVTHVGAMVTTRSAVYDAVGRTVSETDELGRVQTTSYSEDGTVTTITTPAGATLITARHKDGSVAHVYGTGQRELYHAYDSDAGRVRETVYSADHETVLSRRLRNGFDEVVAEAVPSTSGFIYTRYEYDAKGRVVKSYQDAGVNTTPMAATLCEYDAVGNICKKTLALAEEPTVMNSPIEEYAYAAEASEDGIYAVVSMTRYSAVGNPLLRQRKSLISALSGTLERREISIDERGFATVQTSSRGSGTKRIATESIPTSEVTSESVIVDDFVVSSRDHAGIVSSASRSYTSAGMTQTRTDGRGNTVTTHTDLAGRTVSVTDAAGNQTVTVYSPCCNHPATVTDAQGNTSCYRYDVRGRKTAEWGTALQPACFGYDDADRLTSLTTFRAGTETVSTDPSERTDGDTTTWGYHDASGLETSKTYADGKGMTKTYDAFNRLRTETDGRGTVKTHSYEQSRGLLLGTTYSDGTAARAYSYNHLGQLIQVTDDAGVRSIGYNSYGEPESDSLLAGGKTHLITELRDVYGRSSGYTYANNGSVQQTLSTVYGTDGRINSAGFMYGGEIRSFGYTYLPGSNLLQTLTKPNNMSLSLAYEAQRDLLTGMTYRRAETVVAARSYVYDSLGRPTSRSTARSGSEKTDTFQYTSRGELLNAVMDGLLYGYDFDNIGNRRMMQEGQDYATYLSNNLNQYTSVNGVRDGEEYSFSPTYDDAGNQTSVKTSTGVWSVVYNAENRPVTFTQGNTVIECSYDYMGRRATKKVTVDGSVTLYQRFIYRGYLQIACCDLTRTAHPCLWLITWDPTQPIATRPLAIQKDGTWYTYGWDLTKNITEIFGTTGYIRTAYSYTPFGEVSIAGEVAQPIQWSSEYFDEEQSLTYFNYRYFNSSAGRWLLRDFINERDEYSLYAYVTNSPLIQLDVIGLRRISKEFFTGSIYTDAPAEFDAFTYTPSESNCSRCMCEKVTFEIKTEVSISFSGEFRGFSAMFGTGYTTTITREVKLEPCSSFRFRFKFRCFTEKQNFFLWALTLDFSVLRYRLTCEREDVALEEVDISQNCPNCK